MERLEILEEDLRDNAAVDLRSLDQAEQHAMLMYGGR